MGIFQGLGRLIKGEPFFQPGDNLDKNRPAGLPPVQNQGQGMGQPGQPVQPVQPGQPGQVDRNAYQNQPAATAPQQQIQQQGPKILPLALIEKIDINLSGNNMDCYFSIQNNSQQLLEMDKIRMLGTYRELDRQLKPGEEYKFTCYSGPRPRDNYRNEIELEYKNESGDYFEARHHIDFQQQPDGTYSVLRVRFVPPVRDI